jgi:tRNA(Ile2) C34 agmatinyltransferase TiaS
VPPCVDDDETVVMGEGLLGGVVVRFRGHQQHFKTKDEAVAWVESQLKPKHPTRPCPNCGAVMSSLLFMGAQPDGFVCPRCKLYVSPQGVLLGTVIS